MALDEIRLVASAATMASARAQRGGDRRRSAAAAASISGADKVRLHEVAFFRRRRGHLVAEVVVHEERIHVVRAQLAAAVRGRRRLRRLGANRCAQEARRRRRQHARVMIGRRGVLRVAVLLITAEERVLLE